MRNQSSTFLWKKIIYLSLFAMFTTLIFALALTPGTTSSQESGFFSNIIICTLRFIGITLDDAQIGIVSLLVRKLIGHFGLFFVDGAFGFLGIYYLLDIHWKRLVPLIISLGILLAIAIVSELLQLFADGRAAALLDVMIDYSGALLAIGLMFLIKYRAEKKEQA